MESIFFKIKAFYQKANGRLDQMNIHQNRKVRRTFEALEPLEKREPLMSSANCVQVLIT